MENAPEIVTEVNSINFSKIIEEWLRRNDMKIEFFNILCKKYKERKFGINQQSFYITHKFKMNKYMNAIGFSVKEGIVKCRHFYKSQSEGCWRIGTGWRDKGVYVKGAEISNDKNIKSMEGGYIGEGLLHFTFSDYLEKFNENIKITNSNNLNLFDFIKPFNKEYFDLKKSLIQKEYYEERNIIEDSLIKLISN